ncbi:hypothetical protein NY536_26570, partial [Enterobacter hormaechei]|nr:hypothetical protein [Enterobacter hormaechei]
AGFYPHIRYSSDLLIIDPHPELIKLSLSIVLNRLWRGRFGRGLPAATTFAAAFHSQRQKILGGHYEITGTAYCGLVQLRRIGGLYRLG